MRRCDSSGRRRSRAPAPPTRSSSPAPSPPSRSSTGGSWGCAGHGGRRSPLTRVVLWVAGRALAGSESPSARQLATARVARLRATVEIVTLPTTDTVVTYPAGDTTAEARVLHVESVELTRGRTRSRSCSTGRRATRSTPPGPIRARIARCSMPGDVAIEVLDCVVGATDGTALFLGADIPVRKGTEGWAFVVVHLLDADASLDRGRHRHGRGRRRRTAPPLSAGHSACHLASLALNAALAGAWSKETGLDGLGSPDFDGAAIVTLDDPRERVARRLPGRQVGAQEGLRPVGARRPGGARRRRERDPGILDRRRRRDPHRPRRRPADRPPVLGRRAGRRRARAIACGGTHVTSIGELGAVTVALETEQLEGAVGMTMVTRVG